MPLSGRKLTIEQALALCRRRGFTSERLRIAVALMCAESGRYVEAYNINAAEDGSKSIDRGLFQINSQHIAKLGMAESFQATPNVRFAFKLSKQGTDFTPWMAYVNGKHEAFMGEVTAVFEVGAWRALVPTITEELEGP